MEDIYGDFWQVFLEETGTEPTNLVSRYTYFGTDEEESVTALEQLLSGEKTALSHCVPDYLTTKRPMPRIGDYTMVTDFYGNPCCIVRAVDVTIAPLPEIPEALIQAECPGMDRETWLLKKQEEYEALAKRGGFHFHAENPVLMEQVQVVYPVKTEGGQV